MQIILEALANENLQICPLDVNHQSKGGQSMKRVCKLEESLNASLNTEEKELLKMLEDTLGDVSDGNETDRFIRGFRLGALMMVEVFDGRDNLVAGTNGQ